MSRNRWSRVRSDSVICHCEKHPATMSSPFAVTDLRKIGIGLTAFGLAFSVLGILLLFDKGLLAMGNVLYLSGVMLIIGPSRSVKFFFQKRKVKASVFFFIGMAVVLFGWPIVGMAVEIFGFINLFGDFFPVVIAFLRRAPVSGKILSLPGIRYVGFEFCFFLIPNRILTYKFVFLLKFAYSILTCFSTFALLHAFVCNSTGCKSLSRNHLKASCITGKWPVPVVLLIFYLPNCQTPR